jgi:wyosine [tRNA(Phe)-imidazoG37] synthetase (radical SAM superfamily)
MQIYNEEIVSLSAVNYFPTIDWILGNYCNYKCSYCFGDLNTGTFRIPEFNLQLQNNIFHLISELKSKINSEEKIKFQLAGGEPTLYHDIEKLCNFLKEHSTISLITNGSRSIRWWKENLKYFDQIDISFHNEFSDINHIENLLSILAESNVKTFLSFMLDPDTFDYSFHNLLKFNSMFKEYTNVEIKMKLLRNTSNRKINYTEHQKNLINQIDTQLIHKNQIKRSTYMLLSSGKKISFTNAKQKDMIGNWVGYSCDAPYQFLQINQYGNIGKMSCGFNFIEPINIFNEDFIRNFSLPEKKIICSIEKNCGCLGLLLSTKNKVN